MNDARLAELASWETVDRRLVVDRSPWLRVWSEKVRLPDGRTVEDFYALEKPDYAVVFGILPDGRVPAIWHYKHGPRRVTLGLPAGHVEPGEEPLAAARRELREETGHESSDWTPLGSYSVDGNLGSGQAHVFLARNLRQVAPPYPDDLEAYLLESLTFDELRAHLKAGRVATLGAAAAITLGLASTEEEVES